MNSSQLDANALATPTGWQSIQGQGDSGHVSLVQGSVCQDLSQKSGLVRPQSTGADLWADSQQDRALDRARQVSARH